MITFKDLHIGYKRALVNCSSNRANKGQLIGLTGANGAGKSTLLKTFAGLLPPLQGEVMINNEDTQVQSVKTTAQQVAYVFSRHTVYGNVTVQDVVEMGRIPYLGWFRGMKAHDIKKVEEAIEIMGLGNLTKSRFLMISDGERQKTLLAKCLAQETPLILLDEPTAFLDPPSKQQLFRHLKKLTTDFNRTIIVSSHNLELIEAHCDNIWMVHSEKLWDRNKNEQFRTLWEAFKAGKKVDL